MKKIMFNDRYGLTDAVLSGRKTQTRCIVRTPKDMTQDFWNPTMGIDDRGKVHFSVDYIDGKQRDLYPNYQPGEVLAIAQPYWDLRNDDRFYEALQKADPTFPLEYIEGEKGCHNKMFVRAAWMPHRIRITDIGIKPLQDITDSDCRKEGIMEDEFMNTWDRFYYDQWGDVANHITFRKPRQAFASLIDKTCGKGTWQRNPWVWVYHFERIA